MSMSMAPGLLLALLLSLCGGAVSFAPLPLVAPAASSRVSATSSSSSLQRQSLLRLRAETVVDKDKEEVTDYFNKVGFERWNKIYSDSDEVNSVQMDIRDGHGQTVDKVLAWVDADGSASSGTFCDAGCGVGSLAIPLASRGARVSASDISKAMTTEASARAKAQLGAGANKMTFTTSDLESLKGSYDTVCCIDVMIHYPTDKMKGMVQKLSGMAKDRVIISFAPDTWYYTLLKKIGEFFPGPSKTTRAYLHKEEDVVRALNDAGFDLARTEMTATSFYFSRLLEAKRRA
jgi:magnesium-protoporphyrin O-methyltransferase